MCLQNMVIAVLCIQIYMQILNIKYSVVDIYIYTHSMIELYVCIYIISTYLFMCIYICRYIYTYYIYRYIYMQVYIYRYIYIHIFQISRLCWHICFLQDIASGRLSLPRKPKLLQRKLRGRTPGVAPGAGVLWSYFFWR